VKLFFFISLIFMSFVVQCVAEEMKGEKMSNLETNTILKNWRELWSDGSELLLIRLPDYLAEQKLYEVKDKTKESITHKVLSSDSKKAAFTVGTFGSSNPSDGLYILEFETGDLKKVFDSPEGMINLRGFVGDEQLLLDGYIKIENGVIKYAEKSADGAHYFYLYNFKNNQLEDLSDLGVTTVGMANAKCALNGYSFAYDQGDGFVVYNILEKRNIRINEKGELVGISSNGQKILIHQEEGYSLIKVAEGSKELVLSTTEIQKVTPIFNGYFELHFQSWSPDGKFVLFGESSDQNEGKGFLLNLETKELRKI